MIEIMTMLKSRNIDIQLKEISKTTLSSFSHQWKVALDAKDPYGSGLRLVTFASSTPTYRGFPSDLEK